MDDAIGRLVGLIRGSEQSVGTSPRQVFSDLFGERYHKRHLNKTAIRDALVLASMQDGDQGVPFAGLINPDNPESGPYGGTSLVWFPTKEHGSLITYVVGTRGLSPDEGILTRPGHRRRVAALRRVLANAGVESWSKMDPASLNTVVPKTVTERLPGFERVFARYGHEIYCLAHIPPSAGSDEVRSLVTAMMDLYSYERGWEIMAAFRHERERLLARLRQDLFPSVTADTVYERLETRHFVILQGPPGTGKTRLAGEVLKGRFEGNGFVVQFHPAYTYEDFVVGLSPDTAMQQSLRFRVRPGALVDACLKAQAGPFLLVIDEINRAELGKILGEAIYLFEPDEVGTRAARLAYPVGGSELLSLPDNLYVLGTMNTADRTISSVDLAIRRRFTFITMMPDASVVDSQGLPLASEFFTRVSDVFVEHAPDEALNLLPGHAYFMADNEEDLKKRFRYELLPLLEEYQREGFLGSATTELHAVRDALYDAVR